MRTSQLSSPIQVVILILVMCAAVRADIGPYEEAAKLLPERIGDFKAIGQARGFEDRGVVFSGTSSARRDYTSSKGERVTVELSRHASDSGAYAQLNPGSPRTIVKTVDVGTLGYHIPDAVFFFKGSTYVAVRSSDRKVPSEKLLDFARQLADTLDKGEGDIPALVKHLPGYENGDLHPSYAVQPAGLKQIVPNQPVFDAISFEGGVAAAAANYGNSQLVIVEFNTPQLATDNDGRIKAKTPELRSQGQAAPTGYRRVGNYAVFVFNAPDEQAANQLIDQVKYQQVVQWLGENPFAYEKATREFTETTLGVLVAVVQTSGLALLACLAVGGFLGALLFRVRRSQQRAREAYADSDAMLRLNLDDLTPENDPPRLLNRGD